VANHKDKILISLKGDIRLIYALFCQN